MKKRIINLFKKKLKPGPKNADTKDITILASLIDKIEIRGMVSENGRNIWKEIYRTSNERDIDSFFKTLEILPLPPNNRTRSVSDFSFVFYSGKEELEQIGFISPDYLRWEPYWTNDVRLKSTKLLYWMEDRGINEPLRKYKKLLEIEEESRKEQESLLRASPKAFVTKARNAMQTEEETKEALHKEIPDEGERIRALFNVYGASTTPWTQSTGLDLTAYFLLLEIEPESVIKAIDLGQMDETMKDGMSRFFCNYKIRKNLAQEISSLSSEIKTAIEESYKLRYGEDENSGLFD